MNVKNRVGRYVFFSFVEKFYAKLVFEQSELKDSISMESSKKTLQFYLYITFERLMFFMFIYFIFRLKKAIKCLRSGRNFKVGQVTDNNIILWA